MDVALVTCAELLARPDPEPYLQNVLREDHILSAALARRGLGATRVDWADPAVDWDRVGVAVIRTTWDYFHRFEEFSPWLDAVARRTRLLNPLPTLRWNVDKHYLLDLERAGVRIVPTRVVEPGETPSLRGLLDAEGWSEAVVKPAVSGAARLTWRVPRAEVEQHEARFAACVHAEAMLVQPFVRSVVEEGESSIMVLGGRVTHAVQKRAKAGDFRVQDDFGGTVARRPLGAEEAALAEHIVAAAGRPALYGRVDLVRDDEGRWMLGELELVEPELWLRFCEEAAEPFAEGIAAALGGAA